MKKFDKSKIPILKRRAKKLLRRKIRSHKKKKQRNIHRIGRSKEQQRKNINQQAKRWIFNDYERITAPNVFSLIENTEESLSFIKKIESCFERKKKVFIDLENVESIAHGAIVVLLSILVKFKTKGIQFNGNFPQDKRAEDTLKKSGFLKKLFDQTFVEQDVYSFKNEICTNTHANKKVDSNVSAEIIERASIHIWNEKRICTGLQRVFLELMQNTNNHASLEDTGEHHWWVSVYHSEHSSKVCFAFIDYGVGIFTSLENKKEDHKFFKIIPKLKKLFNPSTNADVLKLLLKGEVHKTATGEYYRGKGLPGIFDACKNNKISDLVIISNDAIADYANNKYESLNNKLSGTFVYWELNATNCSGKVYGHAV